MDSGCVRQRALHGLDALSVRVLAVPNGNLGHLSNLIGQSAAAERFRNHRLTASAAAPISLCSGRHRSMQKGNPAVSF
jgi:hypothetical protein